MKRRRDANRNLPLDQDVFDDEKLNIDVYMMPGMDQLDFSESDEEILEEEDETKKMVDFDQFFTTN